MFLPILWKFIAGKVLETVLETVVDVAKQEALKKIEEHLGTAEVQSEVTQEAPKEEAQSK